jgi:Xaa-Pro dipeptidase
MSKDDFELSEFKARQSRVRAAMVSAGIDLLLVFHPVNIQYLIGSRAKSYQEFQVLFFPLEEAPLTILTRLAEVPELTDHSLAGEVRGWGGREPEDPLEAFRTIMQEKGFLSRRIGLEVPEFYMHPYSYRRITELLGDALVMDASFLIHDLKIVKSPAELAYMRKAASIADAAIQSVVGAVAEGASEMEVAGEAYRTLFRLGSDSPASPMNFVSGERTCYGHGAPSERRFKSGDFMHIEYGAAYRRYCATIGRQLCLGEPSPRMREIYQVVRDACDACIAEIRAGVPARRPHEAAKKVIADAGLDRYRIHTTGYGIAPGFPPSWGEYIHLFADSTYTLEAGMVVSIEPPVMIHEERLGARIIDDVLVTETGAEILSGFTRDLILV